MTIYERIFDENETSREHGNRIYTGVIGWRWVAKLPSGEIIDRDRNDEPFRTKRDAMSFVTTCRNN